MLRIARFLNSERGQVLPMFVMLLVSFMALAGLAIDAGRVYVARAELTRALDSAALAGVIELPNTTNAQNRATAYMTENQPNAVLTFPSSTANNQFRVKGTRTVKMLFMRILGINTVNIKANAAAGFGIVPVDTYLTLDATGSMHTGCNDDETTTGGACPIKEARDAANNFVDILLGTAPPDGLTLIGAGAFRGCYNQPRNNSRCIDATPPGSMITNLTSNATTIHAGIDSIHAIGATGQPSGGSGTNICQALKKAQDVMFGAGYHAEPSTVRSVVILSDGDNVYNATQVYQASPQSPESPCQPTSPSTSQGDVSPNCRSDTQGQEAKVDKLSKDMADTLASQGVEIYVVAFGLCSGTPNATVKSSSYCGAITNSNTQSDSTSDQRLLKCIASSTAGTNDHFYSAPTAADLPDVFEDIANAIAFRLIE